jgi:predicted Zn-dependent protease with MMP-like domain
MQHIDNTASGWFNELVSQAIDNLPQEFAQKLDNVEVVTQVWPTRDQLDKAGVPPNSTLFGLYQGVPRPRRTQGLTMPDKITLFMGPIVASAFDRQQLLERIDLVLRHEIGHHFGMNEGDLRRAGH